MKKFVTFVCVIACLFSFAGCGEADAQVENHENQLVSLAEKAASTEMIPFIEQFIDSEELALALKVYTAEELEYFIESATNHDSNGNEIIGVKVDGNAFKSAVESFKKAKETVGEVESIDSVKGTVDKNTIIVTMDVTGSLNKGTVEMVFSKDMFLKLENASLSVKQTMGDLMAKAGLNTLLGMGTVFTVLILISLIIASFSLISKVQNRGKKKSDAATGIDNAVAQIVEQEEVAEDDTELVAVIAAAIAAYEGASGADGYVVRSIRKVNR